MARTDQSRDWRTRLSPTVEELESISVEAFACLPEKFRRLCGNMAIRVVDFPDEQVLEDMGLESPFDILGLFEGSGLGERFSVVSDSETSHMALFRRAILDYWSENEETLGDIISHIFICEIGRHFGLSDEDMDAMEAAAE